MQIILFVDPGNVSPPTALKEIAKALKFALVKTAGVDEVDQTCKQYERVIMVFTDPKFSYQFLKKNRWSPSPILYLLLSDKKINISADAKIKLKEVQLQVVYTFEPEVIKSLIKKTIEYKPDSIDDLSFTINEEIKKEHS